MHYPNSDHYLRLHASMFETTHLAYHIRLHAVICKPNPLPQTLCNNVFHYAKFRTIVSDFMQQCSKPNSTYHIRLHVGFADLIHCLRLHVEMYFVMPNSRPLPQTSCSNVFQTPDHRLRLHAAMFDNKFSLSHQTSRSDS